MRKFIGRSVAAAALASAIVVPLAGVASAVPEKPVSHRDDGGQQSADESGIDSFDGLRAGLNSLLGL
ncbi:hypothetical protein SSP35_19_00740 [Streptomyces sp. NBRC 110611]|uniref:hypothetical protein n=1 Tax=Streptomyces sp. NBRC 110611 TaxID=1621259 RepID=UPI000857D292|nr:hypothetical protein [Streptomyces sp. NBRC 110611]GAU70437.1 hypothetical protein SSP35_19_00740 [Streptomyces sp. NBRC 110611]